jgi:hypothetical protein
MPNILCRFLTLNLTKLRRCIAVKTHLIDMVQNDLYCLLTTCFGHSYGHLHVYSMKKLKISCVVRFSMGLGSGEGGMGVLGEILSSIIVYIYIYPYIYL